MSALGFAIAKTILPLDKQRFLILYSKIAIVVYTFLLVLGSVIQNRFLISYELFTLFFMPLYIIFFIYSVQLYKKNHDQLNKTLIYTWLLFLIVNASYYVYYFLIFTFQSPLLWAFFCFNKATNPLYVDFIKSEDLWKSASLDISGFW